MPRPSAIKHPLLARLVRELRLVSREALLRDVENVEALASDVDPKTDYPVDWLTFRITGFRAGGDDDGSPQIISGKFVLADLSAVCEHLCDMAALRENELDDSRFRRPRELCAEWKISPSTFKRLRKQGLACRLVRGKRNVASLLVHESVASWFEHAHRDRLATTRGKPRTPPRVRERIVREALRYRRVLNLSPHAISARLAERLGPSPSAPAIRQMLAKHPRTRAAFGVREHPALRSRLAMLRLHLRGVLPEEIARMAQRSTPVIRRDLTLARAHLLHRWYDEGLLREQPNAGDSPGFDAALAMLRDSRDDPPDGIADDLPRLLDWWQHRKPLSPRQERELAGALAASRSQAFVVTRSLDRLHPSPASLDEAETLARCASLLHERLLHTQGRLIIDTIRVRTQQPPEQLPVALLLPVLRAGVRALSDACLALDPSKSGRLAGAAALGIDRGVTRALREHAWFESVASASAPRSNRAQSVLIPGTSARSILRPLTGLLAWDRWIWPMAARLEAARRDRCARLQPDASTMLTLRFGLGGEPPRTLANVRDAMNLSQIEAAREACKSLAALREAYPPVRASQ
jgi:hypothetical protein